MPSLTPNAKQQFLKNDGTPAAGYKLYTYAAGTGYVTPQATYQDRGGSSANANPIVLDARGEGVIYLATGLAYDYALKDAQGNTIWTRDGIQAGIDSVDLSGTQGAASVGFIQAGDHAVARTILDKSRDKTNVKDWGAKCDGTTDDTAAFQSALNDLSAAGGGTLDLPAGKIKLGAITLPLSVSIRGAGKYVTWIVPAGAQTCFTLAGGGAQAQQTFSDFGIACGSTASVNGFKFTNCLNVGLYRIAFKGCLSNFEIDQGQNYDIDGCDSIGTAALKAGSCKIWSSDDAKYVQQVGLRRYMVDNIGSGVQGPVVYVRRGVFVDLHQVNCNDASVGTAVDFIVIENDCQGCKVVQSGTSAASRGLVIQTGSGVSVSPSFIDIISCDFDQCVNGAIAIQGANWINITAGNVTSSGVGATGTGIIVWKGSSHVLLNGVTIDGYNGTGGTGVYVDGAQGTTDIKIRNCQIDTCYYAFTVANSPTKVTAFGNTVNNCTNKLNGSLSGTGNYFGQNLGFNPIAVAAPAMPAAGAGYTNTLGVRCTVFINSGSITAITLNGVAMGTTNGWFDVAPGDTISISYTGSPSWYWMPH